MTSRLTTSCRRTAIVAVSLVALWPAAAAAAPVDVASDHVALSAYHGYLKAVAASVPTWRTDDDTFVASVATKCRGALSFLKHRPANLVNRAAVFTFGEEVGADLDVAGYAADRAPLAHMAATLTGLKWSSAGTKHVIDAYLSAQRNLFLLTPSRLCAHARALAASRAQRTPRGTLHWLTGFVHHLSAEERTGSGFVGVLQQFESPSDQALVGDTNRTLQQFETAIHGTVRRETHKLIGVLGL